MIKKLKPRKERLLVLLCMIVVGMNLLPMIFAAVVYAAVRRRKWFSEISRPQEATAFVSSGWKGVFPQRSLRKT